MNARARERPVGSTNECENCGRDLSTVVTGGCPNCGERTLFVRQWSQTRPRSSAAATVLLLYALCIVAATVLAGVFIATGVLA